MKHLQVSIALLTAAALLGAGGAEATRYLPELAAPAPIGLPAFSASDLLAARAADSAAAPSFRLDLAERLLLLAVNRGAEEAAGDGVNWVDRFGLELSSQPEIWPLEGVQGGRCTSGCFSLEIRANYRHRKVLSCGMHLGCYKAPDSTEDMDSFWYGYGQADQLSYIRRESIGENVEYEPGPNGRIASRDGVAFGYDQVGRRTLDDRHSYKWDWRGRLYEVRILATGHRIEYEYDALGRLLWRKHRDESDGLIERRDLVWDGNGLVAEIGYSDDAGTEMRWRKTYLPGPGRLDDQYQVHIETFPSDPAIEPIDKVYTYLRDEMGTVIALIEEVPGADPETPPEPALRYLYSPYGEVIQVDGTEAEGVATAGIYDIAKPFPGGQNLLFQGLWADSITGLSFARARWFEARNASWLSEDPKGDVDSPNLYLSFGANPTRLKDSFGSQTAYEYAIDNSAGDMGFSLDHLPKEEQEAIGRGFSENIKSTITAPYDYIKMCIKMGGCQNVDILIVAKAGSHINKRMKDSQSLGGSRFEGAVVGAVELTPVVSQMIIASGEEPYGREYTLSEQGEAHGSLMAEPLLAMGGATVGSCTPSATQQLSKLRKFLSFDDIDLRGLQAFDDVIDDVGDLSRNIERTLDQVSPPVEVVAAGRRGPIKANEVTTYDDFTKRSVVGDNLEGHEAWQHANLNERGHATTRLSTDASKSNPVIALERPVHVDINRAQRVLSPRLQDPLDNIRANIQILRTDPRVPSSAVDVLEEAARRHARSLGEE